MKGEASWLFFIFLAFGAGVAPGAYLRAQAGAKAPSSAAADRGNALHIEKGRKKGRKPQASPASDQHPAAETAEDKLLGLLSGFDPGLSGRPRTLREVAQQYRRDQRGRLLAMVATVPDPDASSLDAYYDQALDAIQRAAASEGFLPDRYYLPWQEAEDEDHAPASVACGDVTLQCRAAGRDGEHPIAEGLPGILLFRRLSREADARPNLRYPSVDLLVVFVVGELPKRGVYQNAFAAALNAACMLRENDHDRLFVLAPFFSGAALSLRLAMAEHERWHEQRQVGPSFGLAWFMPVSSASMVDIISGSALDPANPGIIASGPTPFAAHPEVHFQTTSVPLDQMKDVIVQAIDHRLGGPLAARQPEGASESQDIAMLSESGTQWAASPSVSQWCHKQPCKTGGQGPVLRTFHFPLHIARLRARREKSKHDANADSPMPLADRLELRLDREKESRDDPPAGSSLTPYEIEIMLHAQLEEISRGHFQYLGIIATDPTDLVFIVQEARKYCPGVQIFTLGAHGLFSHPDLMHDLNGVLIASTYPLSALNKHGETFASYTGEGMYNAMVVMLERMRAREADHPPRYKDWDTPFDPNPTGARVWLSMVSNGNIWPIHLEAPPKASVLVEEARDTQDSGVHSHATPQPGPRLGDLSKGLYWFLLLLALVHTGFLLGSRRRKDGTLRIAGTADVVAHVAVMSGALAFTCLLWAAVAWRSVGQPVLALVTAGAGALTGLAALLPLVMAFGTWLRSLRGPRSRRPAPQSSVAAALVLVGAGLILALFAWPFVHELITTPVSPDVRLALARMVQPLSGVSPILPLLWVAMGLYLWGLSGLRRVRARTRLPDWSPIPGRGGAWLERLSGLADDVRSQSAGRAVRINEGIALVLVSGPCLFFLHELLPTFESDAFDPLFKVAFLLLVVAVATDAGRLVARWQQLRELLRHLVDHPMVDAFARAGGGGSPWLRLDLQPERPCPEEVESAVKVIDLLGDVPASSGLQRERARLRAKLTTLSEDSDQRAVTVRELHADLFRQSRTLLFALESLRRMGRRVRAARDKDDKDDKDGQPLPLEALHGADRTIAAAQVLAARQVMTVIRFALGQLRTHMLFVVGGALILVFAIGAYPFHPMRFASVFVWSFVLCAIGVVLWLIIGVEYDGVLSRMAHTRPGHLDFSFAFVSKLVAYGMFPALVVVAKAFPEVGDILFSWLGPVMRAFHH